MQTLKDIKDILKDIPDDTLKGLYFGLGEGAEADISLVAQETGVISKKQIGFPEVFNAYPKLNEINNLLRNIIKAQNILDDEGKKSEEVSDRLFEDGITDNFFSEDKKSSSNQESMNSQPQNPTGVEDEK